PASGDPSMRGRARGRGSFQPPGPARTTARGRWPRARRRTEGSPARIAAPRRSATATSRSQSRRPALPPPGEPRPGMTCSSSPAPDQPGVVDDGARPEGPGITSTGPDRFFEDVHRPRLDLVEDPADVLAEDAEADQLHAA